MHQETEDDEFSDLYSRFFNEDGQPRSEQPIPIAKLVQLFRSSDPRIRSKVARMVGRYSQFQSFVAQRLQESDPRVRANAVESLWKVDTVAARKFLDAASSDSHHRVRINALVGLYLLGNPVSVRLLAKQAKDSSSAFRRAAAWAMGQTLDPRFLTLCQEMASDEDDAVRRLAALSAARIEQRLKNVGPGTPFRARILRASGPDPEWRRLSAVLPRQISESVRPTDFILEENEHPIFTYDVERAIALLPGRLGIAIPEHNQNSAWLAAAAEALTSRIATAARKDSFAIIRYKPDEYTPGYSPQRIRAIYTSKPEVIAQQMSAQTAAGNLQEALDLLSAKVAGPDAERALLMIVEVDESGSDAALFCPGPDFLASLRSRNVPLHAIATGDGEYNPLRAACATTGGIFLQASSAEELKDACATLFSSFADRFEIRYSSEQPFVPGSSVKLTVYSHNGWGQDSHLIQ